LFGQLMLGLVNGSFYAMLSLGLAVIFGLLGVVNFAHGALYMIGAYVAWFSMDRWGISYWWALLLGPLVVGWWARCSSARCSSACTSSIRCTACC
jgi:branched-chain amino acid transport system permease protein